MRRLIVQFPPLAEQRRILVAIEEQFSHLDAGNALLRSARRRLTFQRSAIVSSAIQGSWATKPLGDLVREPLRNGHSAKASGDGTGVRTLTLTAVTSGEFSDENTKLTTADPKRVGALWLEPGDVLIERSNTPELVGTSALYRGRRDWAIFPDLLIRVRVSDELVPEFLEIVLKSRPARLYFRRAAVGIAGSMPKIAQGDVESLRVPVPELDEQQRIVADVERQLSLVGSLSAAVDAALQRSKALRRSILERAFAGKLVPQDPADEPASVLLERIAAERAAAAPVKRTDRGRPRRAATPGSPR